MKILLSLFFATLIAEAKKPNIVLICVDDLRPELHCYGASHIHSPHIDALAARGRLFKNHYVQAPTCGASRFTLLTGRYCPTDNHALILRSQKEIIHPSLPAHFKNNGYTTVSVGKVSHHPGGLCGRFWNDPTKTEMPHSWHRSLLNHDQWQHPKGWMHGLANGKIRKKASEMPVFEAIEGDDSIYPDGPSTQQALEQLDTLAKSPKPFFLAVGILRPHLPFGAPLKYLQRYKDTTFPPIPHPNKPPGKTTWHHSNEFMKYKRWGKNPNKNPEFATEVRKHYAACVTYADAQVGQLLQRLKTLNLDEQTIIILWGDHGWHLGEHAVWGKHTLFEESLHAPLIITTPNPTKPGKESTSLASSIDLFPTLCDLAQLPKPKYLHGQSLLPILQNPDKQVSSHIISYTNGAQTIRTNTHRLIKHRNGHVELYDHTSPEKETKNIAPQNTKLTEKLSAQIKDALE